MKFLIDSDVLIQAYKMYYPLDVAPGFWRQLHEAAAAGEIQSIDRVRNEVYTNPDELTQWCDDHLPDEFFLDTSDCIVQYASIIRWGESRDDHYNRTALAELATATNADPWLVAMAMANQDYQVVTQERSNPARRRRVMLPDICTAHGVLCRNTIDRLRLLGRSF